MDFCSFSCFVAVKEVGPVDGDEPQECHGAGIEGLVFEVSFGVGGYASEVDKGVEIVLCLSIDIEEGIAQRDGNIGDDPFADFKLAVKVQFVVAGRGF